MKIGALTLFGKMHSNGNPCSGLIIAAWHWRWSRTWRWGVWWNRYYRHGKSAAYFLRVYRGNPGLNFHAGLNLPILGHFNIQTQPNQDLRAEMDHSRSD